MRGRIHIEAFDDVPLHELRYLNAAPRGGTSVERLPIQRASLGPLPDELDAIIACSDLQGIVPGRDGESQLLGVEVAYALEELAFDGVIPPAARTGVLLAGDLYSVPEANKRGGFGDVADVWRAFAERFAWVAGVAGNHDGVEGVHALARSQPHVHLLDGDTVTLDGLVVGGVGLIIGGKAKPGRRMEDAQLALLERTIDAELDILVLHEGPDGTADGQRGNSTIRELLAAGGVPFTVCGHDHWRDALAAHPHGQVLNVDARVVVMVGTA